MVTNSNMISLVSLTTCLITVNWKGGGGVRRGNAMS